MLDDLSSSNYYDLLELTPDASPQEIRAAYLRAKAAYRKDSVALYTLISEAETEDLLHKIEEAYQILSSPERRKDYDRNHGLLVLDERTLAPARAPRQQKIISIDRVPPMESGSGDGDLLVPPSTDFTQAPRTSSGTDVFGATEAPLSHARAAVPSSPFETESNQQSFGQAYSAGGGSGAGGLSSGGPSSSSGSAGHAATGSPAFDPSPVQIPTRPSVPLRATGPEVSGDSSIQAEIAQEAEWKGTFLRRVREARQVSIEELSDFTKINKSYILAIEEENFQRLPAPVFLRGFITQISKFLKLPAEKVAPAYMARASSALSAAKAAKG